MAGLEPMMSLIYFEKQQPGSMLCAQHALNNLLQGNYFTAPDLSAIANSLDTLEGSVHTDAVGGPSMNMDDTGFFSVQVLENALTVWGLDLLRWRSPDMRAYQDNPHVQHAFILNLQQHWFTLRRFGQASPTDANAGDGHWFNLNSSLEGPEWVSKTYLGMVLQQAEAEGYSVFVITEQHPGALPRTEADEVASTLPEPSSASGSRLSTSRAPPKPNVQGFEDEDMELQAALQASLMGGSADELLLPEPRQSYGSGLELGPGQSASVPLAGAGRLGSGTRTPTGRMPGQFGALGEVDDDVDMFGDEEEEGEEEYRRPPQAQQQEGYDPVAASMARNRATMERMRREQEMALRAGYAEEIARFGTRQHGPAESQAARGQPAGQDDEDEMLKRAIEESRAAADASGSGQQHQTEIGNVDSDDELDDEADSAAPRIGVPPPIIAGSGPQGAWNPNVHRVYDDDDAELQAALKASLEQLPEGFVIPEDQPLPARTPGSSQIQSSQPARSCVSRSPSKSAGDEGDSEVESEADSSSVAEAAPVEEQLSMEEIRRRRLAKFGG